MSDLRKMVANFMADESIKELSIPMTPIRDIEDLLVNDHGYGELELDGGEINGWQIDFWYDFFGGNGPNIRLQGSLHYGDFKLVKYE